MLKEAETNLGVGSPQVEFRQGELDDLPLEDQEVDAVFANMVMHHVPDLHTSLGEMHRVIKPGGTLVITDILPHRESWMTEVMADLRLGLDPRDLAHRARSAGFGEVSTESINDAHVVESPDGERVHLPMFLMSLKQLCHHIL